MHGAVQAAHVPGVLCVITKNLTDTQLPASDRNPPAAAWAAQPEEGHVTCV